eukprot:CAMPEP_0184308402 /NCGR_PEP_ID=MMETSP1049-20130417/16866_1 /TAXON_ID=77928 /ORGANISM="Proteomonas sulcata, Strain CCMP704" /LENGTH=331 /DNA_ID=CAMNT_0026621085 /DNA_START=15 /DNA_END=1010 /DNA_ORIENTATION=+
MDIAQMFPQILACVNIQDKDLFCYPIPTSKSLEEVQPVIGLPLGVYPQVRVSLYVQDEDGQGQPLNIVSKWRKMMVTEPQKKLCVVVPYRDGCIGMQQGEGRRKNLHIFLDYMVKFLKEAGRQAFEIIITEQSQEGLFNKGVLFNIGTHVSEDRGCEYVTLHDVDQIPTNPRNDYHFVDRPLHMCTYSTQYDYLQWPPGMHVGGVVMSSMDSYRAMNGYSNKYYGWGLEDNDQWYRIKRVFGEIDRLPQQIGHYRDLPHPRIMGLDMTVEYNDSKAVLEELKNSEGLEYIETDGYAQVSYYTEIASVTEESPHVVRALIHVLKNGDRQPPC